MLAPACAITQLLPTPSYPKTSEFRRINCKMKAVNFYKGIVLNNLIVHLNNLKSKFY